MSSSKKSQNDTAANSKRKRKDLFEQWIEDGTVENNLAIVQSLSMQGKSTTEIAEAFDISKRTLMNLQKEHSALANAIQTGRLSVVAMCQNKLMERVSSGDTTAIIYALKVYGGDFFNDRKTVKAEITGDPVSVQPQVQIYLPATDTEAGDTDGKEV
ncbi:MAG: hypothetical protein IJ711_00155 [Lachnospiraceae bacterium]|nr:hypothetical protein [Clostridia bacterium]MBR1691167.1 hypothetical protein [Lachnospiraceae bacterium]